MQANELMRLLCEKPGVSGHEIAISNLIVDAFTNLSDEVERDNLGNVIALKKGENNLNNIKIMLSAHMDEIGLMVTDIDDRGFISFTTIGGIDPRTLLAQEVVVHGKEDLFGVIGAKPPHLQDESEREKAVRIEDLTIDVGYSKEQLKDLVEIGNVVTISRNLLELRENWLSGKALDDRAGIVTMYECANELKYLKHEADIYFVSTVQEEVGVRGATTSTYKINPDIGIAIDVGFGATPDIPKEYTLDMGKGPGITIGGNIHPRLREKLIEVAKENYIPYQLEIDPGPTGTDARAMQITRCGIPTLLISLPLRYMHTSIETINMNDIKMSAKLIARFISYITHDNLEGLLCY